MAVLALGACSDATASGDHGEATEDLYDWPNGGTEGFTFLPATIPSGGQPFDATLSPVVTICRITNDVCGTTLATYTKTSSGTKVTVNTGNSSYNVTWPASGVSSGQVYRIKVTVGSRELGYHDVKFASTTSQYNAIDQTEYRRAWVGSTYPISFRIDQGIPQSITLSVSSLSVTMGDAKTVTATVRDLRNQVMTNPEIYWEIETTSSPGPVVALDSGLVVAVNAGTANLWVWTEDVMVSIPVTVTDNRRAWTVMSTPDNQGFRGIWGTASNNVYAANYLGLQRYNGSAWQHVPVLRWRSFYDVYGTAADNVYAVGEKGLIVHYDGSAWSAEQFNGTSFVDYDLASTASPARKYTLRALWGVDQIVVAVGDSGAALYNDGANWIRVPTGVNAALTDVWGTDYNNFYATTDDGRLLKYQAGAVVTVTNVVSAGPLYAVWGTAYNNVYVAGAGGILYRYNGATWTRIRLPTRATLYAVWGTSATNVFVAGAGGALYRYDGTSWTPEKTSGGNSQVYGFWGTSSGADVFASGAGGLIAKR